MQTTDSTAKVDSTIAHVAPHGDLIGWQEVETPAQLAAVRALPGFTTYAPAGSASFIPISWRTSLFTLLGSGSRRVHGGVAHVTPSRYVNHVVLLHRKSGATITRVNTHVVSHIDVAGHARGTDMIRGQLGRAELHFHILHGQIVDLSHVSPVIWGGDLNVDYHADRRLSLAGKGTAWFPYTMLKAVTAFDMPAGGTHGARAIDWTGHTTGSPLTAAAPVVLALTYSDHHPVQTVFTI